MVAKYYFYASDSDRCNYKKYVDMEIRKKNYEYLSYEEWSKKQ